MDPGLCGLRLSPEEDPHFGFVREGGVYTQRIHIINENPNQAMRFNIIGPHNSNRTETGQNKVRLFIKNSGNLPSGLKTIIDIVFLAAKPGLFVDTIKVTTPASSRVIEIQGLVVAEPELAFVHKRLHLEGRPLLKPGVVCLGTIKKGQRKYVSSPFPAKEEETIVKGQRLRSNVSIASSFPEEMEARADRSTDRDPDMNLLKQLKQQEVAELRTMPYVTATFWDMHQCKQLLSKRLMKWPTDKTKDIKLHCEQVLKDEAVQLSNLERKGFLSSRLLAALQEDKTIGEESLDEDSTVSREELALGSNSQGYGSCGSSSSTGESVLPADKGKHTKRSVAKTKREMDDSPLYNTVGTPKILINLSTSLETATNTAKII